MTEPESVTGNAASSWSGDMGDDTMTNTDHLTSVGAGCTPVADLTAWAEAQFATAFDQAIATGRALAPIEVLHAFGVLECDDESADWLGRPDLALVDQAVGGHPVTRSRATPTSGSDTGGGRV